MRNTSSGVREVLHCDRHFPLMGRDQRLQPLFQRLRPHTSGKQNSKDNHNVGDTPRKIRPSRDESEN